MHCVQFQSIACFKNCALHTGQHTHTHVRRTSTSSQANAFMIYSTVLLNSSSSSSSSSSLAYIPQCTLHFSLFGALVAVPMCTAGTNTQTQPFFGSTKRAAQASSRSANMGGHAIACCGTPRSLSTPLHFSVWCSIVFFCEDEDAALSMGRRHSFRDGSCHSPMTMLSPISNAIQSFYVHVTALRLPFIWWMTDLLIHFYATKLLNSISFWFECWWLNEWMPSNAVEEFRSVSRLFQLITSHLHSRLWLRVISLLIGAKCCD